jgi:cephalosporin hydroxylase
VSRGTITIDFDRGTVEVLTDSGTHSYALGSSDGFDAVSQAWLRSGWDAKYVYSFTWLGRPIIQLPDDLLRIQEVIATVQPNVVIETGIAHGGSLVFSASLLKAMDIPEARVIGVDIEIRPHNRNAIENHVLRPYLTLIEGSSTDAKIVGQVRSHVRAVDRVLVLLDSNHTKAHVLAELEAYAPMVTAGSFIIIADGIMESLAGAPRSAPDWTWNNPRQAVVEFVSRHPDYAIEEPPFLFNEGSTRNRVTYCPQAFIRRIR